jgi:hypothetical protein
MELETPALVDEGDQRGASMITAIAWQATIVGTFRVRG